MAVLATPPSLHAGLASRPTSVPSIEGLVHDTHHILVPNREFLRIRGLLSTVLRLTNLVLCCLNGICVPLQASR